MTGLPDFEALGTVLSNASPIHTDIDAGIAFALVAQLQLALRHPANKGASAELIKGMALQLQAKLGEIDPAIAQALNQGWDESLDSTPEEFEQMQAGQRVVVHNVYALYELDQDGSRAEQPLLTFNRPQDWGDSQRWYYHTCLIEFKSHETHYVNHCHLWQEVERNPVEAFQAIAPALFMVMQPGQPPQLCGREYLEAEDFWSDEWGNMPPVFATDSEDYDDFDPDDYYDNEPNDFGSPRS